MFAHLAKHPTAGATRLYDASERSALAGRALLLLLLFGLAASGLFAQSNTDEHTVLKYYALPQSAVPFAELAEADGIWLRSGKPFSGIAYERFDNQKLSRVFTLFQGKQQGPSYLWYPSGAPMMSANYRQGALQGRFLGWYQNGGVIYDMMLNHGAYTGDYIEDDRAQTQDDPAEGEGDGIVNDAE